MSLRVFLADEKAQMIVEYGLILLLLALAAMAGLHLFGASANNSLNNSAQRYPS
jgi:Flp pilus assembly pilin Flp